MTHSHRLFRLGVVASTVWVVGFGLFVMFDFWQSRTSLEWLLDSSLCRHTWLTQTARAECESQWAKEWSRRQGQLGWVVLPAIILLALGAAPAVVSRANTKSAAG
jgi:hypothetical protein